MSPATSSPCPRSGSFIVECGEARASFHKERFGPSGKSVCVLFKGEWMTPLQFEDKAGLGASHNWKRSLRHKGKAMTYWISKGLIKPCQKYCGCQLCRNPTPKKSTSAAAAAAAAAATSSPSSSSSPSSGVTPPQNLTLLKIKDLSNISDDSDSGISMESYSKALKVDVSTPADEITSTSCSSVASSSSVSNPPDSNLPDYTTMVQEALYSLKDASAGMGCSQMNILLYVLHKYSPKEEIRAVNAKVKAALQFLARMDIVQKILLDGVEESNSDLEEGAENEISDQITDQGQEKQPEQATTSITTKVPESTTTTVKKVKRKDKLNKEDNTKTKLKKKKKVSMKKTQKSNDGLKIRPKAKKLSGPLSAICAVKKANRQDVLKALWNHVKTNKLQDPKDPTVIFCDEKLKAVMKKKKIAATDMLRGITEHMFTIEEKK